MELIVSRNGPVKEMLKRHGRLQLSNQQHSWALVGGGSRQLQVTGFPNKARQATSCSPIAVVQRPKLHALYMLTGAQSSLNETLLGPGSIIATQKKGNFRYTEHWGLNHPCKTHICNFLTSRRAEQPLRLPYPECTQKGDRPVC